MARSGENGLYSDFPRSTIRSRRQRGRAIVRSRLKFVLAAQMSKPLRQRNFFLV
jgi:hypothetical protein